MKYLKWKFAILGLIIFTHCEKEAGINPKQNGVPKKPVRIKFLGHSSFSIITPDTIRIVTDPFGSSLSQFYRTPDPMTADLVTVSHFHADHCQTQSIQGNPIILNKPDSLTIGTVRVRGYLSEHGKWNGSPMGNNIIFVFQVGDLKIVHLGENRNVTEPEILSAIAQADILIAPVGQIASIRFGELNNLIKNQQIRTAIPSHYSLSADNRYYASSTVEEYLESLPEGTKIVYADSLEMLQNMPEQVVVLSPLYKK